MNPVVQTRPEFDRFIEHVVPGIFVFYELSVGKESFQILGIVLRIDR